MLSGTRANIAIKLFGDDLGQLRTSAESIRKVVAEVEGVVDLSVEQRVDIPQLAVTFDRQAIARYGFCTGALAETLGQLYAGVKVTQVLDQQRTYDVLVGYGDAHRADLDAIRNTLIDTPTGQRMPLKMLAAIREDTGPNTVSRENVQRKIVIMANVGGRDLRSVVDDIRLGHRRQGHLARGLLRRLRRPIRERAGSTRTISLLGIFVVAGIFLLLFLAFRSVRSSLLIMVNLLLALIGGVVPRGRLPAGMACAPPAPDAPARAHGVRSRRPSGRDASGRPHLCRARPQRVGARHALA